MKLRRRLSLGRKLNRAMAVVLAAIFLCQCIGRAAPASRTGLATQDGLLIRNGKPYRGVGANYFDLFLRILQNPKDTSSLRGLARLAKAKIPFVRFAGPFTAKDWNRYFYHREEYLRCFDLVVHTAEQAKIGLIPSMFWTPVLPDTADEPRDQWGNPDSKTIARMRQYVADVVSRYRHSPAIWGWEFGNEVNLTVDMPDVTEQDNLKSEHMSVMLSEFAKEVRKHDPNRPIFSGNSHPRISAWHNANEGNWKPDTEDQFREIILRDNPSPLDTIGVHFYGDLPVQEELGVWTTGRGEWLRTLNEVGRKVGRPVFVGEYGVMAKADKQAVRTVFEELLFEMEQAEVDLAAFWVFDLSSQNGSCNVTFDNDRSYMIKLTAKANRRWNRAARHRK